MGHVSAIRKTMYYAFEELAKIIGCSRKTLNNRDQPIKELKQIKTTRKTLKQEQVKKRDCYKDQDKIKSNEEILVLRIEKFQNENGHLFEKVQNLEEQLKIERELRESLDKSVNLLKKKTSICKQIAVRKPGVHVNSR